MDDKQVIVRHGDTLASVILNRSERLHALTEPMWLRFAAAFGERSANDGVHCVVLPGANRSFSLGADKSRSV